MTNHHIVQKGLSTLMLSSTAMSTYEINNFCNTALSQHKDGEKDP